jgi:hypothetical protein
MTPARAMEIYQGVPVEDLHRIRALISCGNDYGEIATRAGLPRAVIRLVALRSRRAERRAAKKTAALNNAAG